MKITQKEKAVRFCELHHKPQPFVIPNPWDAGSARILASLGFAALATSSWASAAAQGMKDGAMAREQVLEHVQTIVQATDLPVSADLVNGFGDKPESVAETIRLVADAGAVGCTIEDATGKPGESLYGFQLSVERIAAAAEAARTLPFPFVLTARAHNFLYPDPSLDDTIARLQAYEKAGADVLFAPALPDMDSVARVCSAVSKPVNFMAGLPGKSFPVSQLAAVGVKRVSVAAALYRAAMTAMIGAARELQEAGTFGFVENSLSSKELSTFIQA